MTLLISIFKFLYRQYRTIPIVSTIHEYTNYLPLLSRYLRVPLYCIQDGYLPDNYSSKYLNYRTDVDTYLVWDILSQRIFKKHKLKSKKSSIFSSTKLSLIPEEPKNVKNILVITSGAGDWTALKNRSDEDRMLEIFIEVAKALPKVNIIYRPHPLWAHPTHQGVNSIQRVFHYINSLNISNLVISTGALKESYDFKNDQKLSRNSKSIENEINTADLIFGDHSQAIINAARRGKMIGSINVSNGRSLFESYNQLGFPNLKSSKEIIRFIRDMGGSSDISIAYNKSVANYNDKYS